MDNGLQFSEESLTHNVIAQKSTVTDATVYYVAVYKQSESGLLFNLRLLVLQDKNFNIFYTKHFKPMHQLSELQKKGGSPIKQQLSVLNTNAEVEQNIITLSFIRDNIKTKWIFRFHNEKLALKWLILYKDIQEKYIAKTIKSKSRETANSANNSQYASILSHNRYYPTFNNSLVSSASKPEVSSESKPEAYNTSKVVKNQTFIQKQEDLQKSSKRKLSQRK